MVPVHEKKAEARLTADEKPPVHGYGRGASIPFPDNAWVMNRDNPDPAIALLPGQFSFYFGSYSGMSCIVRWDGRSLIAEKTGGGNFSGISRRYQPGILQWKEFWRKVDDLGVWSWDASYSAPHGCCSVTYWQLTLSYGGKTVSSFGEDMSPDGQGPASSRVLIALIDAIKVLCRE